MMAWHFGKQNTLDMSSKCAYILHHVPLHFEENWVPKFKMLFLYYIKIIQGFTMIHLNGKLWLTLVEMLLCDSAKMFLTSKFWVTRLTFFPTPPIKLKLRLQVVWSIEYMFHTCCIIFSHHTISLSLLYSRSVIIDAFLAYQEVL